MTACDTSVAGTGCRPHRHSFWRRSRRERGEGSELSHTVRYESQFSRMTTVRGLYSTNEGSNWPVCFSVCVGFIVA